MGWFQDILDSFTGKSAVDSMVEGQEKAAEIFKEASDQAKADAIAQYVPAYLTVFTAAAGSKQELASGEYNAIEAMNQAGYNSNEITARASQNAINVMLGLPTDNSPLTGREPSQMGPAPDRTAGLLGTDQEFMGGPPVQMGPGPDTGFVSGAPGPAIDPGFAPGGGISGPSMDPGFTGGPGAEQQQYATGLLMSEEEKANEFIYGGDPSRYDPNYGPGGLFGQSMDPGFTGGKRDFRDVNRKGGPADGSRSLLGNLGIPKGDSLLDNLGVPTGDGGSFLENLGVPVGSGGSFLENLGITPGMGSSFLEELGIGQTDSGGDLPWKPNASNFTGGPNIPNDVFADQTSPGGFADFFTGGGRQGPSFDISGMTTPNVPQSPFLGIPNAANAMIGGYGAARDIVNQGYRAGLGDLDTGEFRGRADLQGGADLASLFLTGGADEANRKIASGFNYGQGQLGNFINQARGDIQGGFTRGQGLLNDRVAQARSILAQRLSAGRVTGDPTKALAEIQKGVTGAVGELDLFADTGEAAMQREAAFSGALGMDAQQQALDEFIESPGQKFFRERQEQALLRNQAAIGGLGGGNVRSALQEQAFGISAQDQQRQIQNLRALSQMGLTAATQQGGFRQQGGIAGGQIVGDLEKAQMANNAMLMGQELQAAAAAQRASAEIEARTGMTLAELSFKSGLGQSDLLARMGFNTADRAMQGGIAQSGVSERLGEGLGGISTGLGESLSSLGQLYSSGRSGLRERGAGMLGDLEIGLGTGLSNLISGATTNVGNILTGQGLVAGGNAWDVGSQTSNLYNQTSVNMSNLFGGLGGGLANLRTGLGTLLGNIGIGAGSAQSGFEQGIGNAQAAGELGISSLLQKILFGGAAASGWLA